MFSRVPRIDSGRDLASRETATIKSPSYYGGSQQYDIVIMTRYIPKKLYVTAIFLLRLFGPDLLCSPVVSQDIPFFLFVPTHALVRLHCLAVQWV